MDPLTHALTGVCLARAGLNRPSAYATLALVLAAEAPDIDVIGYLGGPITGLEYHRGITHSLLGAPVLALACVGVVWLWSRLRPSIFFKPLNQPLRWFSLWWIALIGILSHLWLDYTNTYGLRPFFPFNTRWYSADLVFIIEPILLALLLFMLVVPWLLGLADQEIGAKGKLFPGTSLARFTLICMTLFWGLRWVQHDRAITLVDNGALTQATLLKRAALPYPLNPFRWMVLAETPESYVRGTADTLREEVASDRHSDTLFKPESTRATLLTKRSYLGEIYLDWSKFPVVEDLGPVPIPGVPEPQLPPDAKWTTVRLRDLRYSYRDLPVLRDREVMSGYAYVLDGQTILELSLNEHEQSQ
jgi:inner membrane protein